MKKLLSVLASLTLVASSSSAVLACSDNTQKKETPDTQEDKKIRNQSIDKIKSYILADQYDLDLEKTKQTVRDNPSSNIKINDFNSPDSKAFQGLNLKGDLGRENKPLYDFAYKIVALLNSFGLKINYDDVTNILNKIGGVISPILGMINAPTVNGIASLVPTVLEALESTNTIPVDKILWDAGPDTQKIISLVADAAKYLNLDFAMAQLVGKDGKTVGQVQQIAADELDYILNDILFRKVSGLEDSGDSRFSKMLGEELLTPILNNTMSLSDAFNNIKNKYFTLDELEWWIPDLIHHVGDFVASIGLLMTVYYPVHPVDNEGKETAPIDADHLFSSNDTNEKVFGANDNIMITSDDGTTIKVSGESSSLSLDATLKGIIDLVANEESSYLGIIKLTNILFHDHYDMSGKKTGNNYLLDKLVYLLVDSLKYTNYEVKVQKKIEDIPVLKSIDLDIDFKLHQLFTPGTPISVNASITTVKLIITNNGLRDITSTVLEPIISMLILGKNQLETNDDKGKKVAAYTNVQNVLKPLWNDKSQSVFLDGGFLVKTALNGSLAWGPIWDKIGPIFVNLMFNIWYKKIDENVKELGIDTTEIDKSLPLSKTINDALSDIQIHAKDQNNNEITFHINVFELSQNKFSIDLLIKILLEVLVENQVQFSGGTGQSLLDQVLPTITKPCARVKTWYTALGYVPDNENHYVKVKSIMGDIYEYVFNKFKNNDPKKNNVVFNYNGEDVIDLNQVDSVWNKSDLNDYLNKQLKDFIPTLAGADLNYLVAPLVINPDERVWTTKNIVKSFFRGTHDIQYESYELVFDSSSMQIKDNNGNIVSVHKGRYKISFSRIDNKSNFEFKTIEKIS